jgi:hypothetical protein
VHPNPFITPEVFFYSKPNAVFVLVGGLLEAALLAESVQKVRTQEAFFGRLEFHLSPSIATKGSLKTSLSQQVKGTP